MSKKKIVIATDEEVTEYANKAEQAGGEPADPSGQENAQNLGGTAEAVSAEQPQKATEAEDYKDKYLRAVAELSNYRKRAERDREEALRYANTGLVRSLLPVLDNLERVVAAAQEHPENTEAIVEGVKLTIGSFRKALNDHQVNSIEAEGQPFDPAVHEAMMQQPSDQYDVPTVLQVLEEGFKLLDRVVRPARVIVSKPAEEKKAE